MKNVLVLALVLVMATMASATVIDVVRVDLGTSGGRMGTNDTTDQLQLGDVIGLKFVLNYNDGSFQAGTGGLDYSSYDGYVLQGMNLTLAADVAGSMSVPVSGKGKALFTSHADWSFPGTPAIAGDTLTMGAAGYGSVAGTIGTTTGISPVIGGTADLLGGMLITADGTSGDIVLTLGLDGNGGGNYYDYIGDGFAADPTLNAITLASLGFTEGALINAVPEPMTIALLGLGGLFLRRRKK